MTSTTPGKPGKAPKGARQNKPGAAGDGAVSLVDKQVSLLRERNQALRQRLDNLTATARDNEQLYEFTRKLVLDLLGARNRDELAATFRRAMGEDFQIEHACLILFDGEGGDGDGGVSDGGGVKNNDKSDHKNGHDNRNNSRNDNRDGNRNKKNNKNNKKSNNDHNDAHKGSNKGERENASACRVEPAALAEAAISALLSGDGPVSGTLRQKELTYLFPDADGIGSAAVVPLLRDGARLGLIAVGSDDAHRYSAKLDTLFLGHIAEVLTHLVVALQGKP